MPHTAGPLAAAFYHLLPSAYCRLPTELWQAATAFAAD